MNQHESTQQAFAVIREIAPLCATPGITPEVTTEVNNIILASLNVIKAAMLKNTAAASGIIV